MLVHTCSNKGIRWRRTGLPATVHVLVRRHRHQTAHFTFTHSTPPPTCVPRRNLASAFRAHVVNSRETDAASLAPVRQFGDASYCYLRASNVYLLAITKRNSNAMMVMQFLSRVGAAAAAACSWGRAQQHTP